MRHDGYLLLRVQGGSKGMECFDVCNRPVAVFLSLQRTLSGYWGVTTTTSMAVSISRSVGHGLRYSLLRSGTIGFLSLLPSPSTATVGDVVASTSARSGADSGGIATNDAVDKANRQL